MTEPVRIQLPAAVRTDIAAEAARTYPHECCGILLGVDGGDVRRIERAIPAANVAEPTRLRDRYVIDPRAMLAAEREAAVAGLEIVATFHSHPDHPPRPSAEDLARAWPFYTYLIITVQAGVPGDLRAWRLNADATAFVELPIEPA